MTLTAEDISRIETLIECEGFERGMRRWSEDLEGIQSKKFQKLLANFLEATEELEDYLADQGVEINED